MAKVFTNSQVAHVWAQQEQDEGRSHNGNFHFVGDTLYSYATPIGRIMQGKSNGSLDGTVPVALISSEGFSITTQTKHLNPARRAVRHMRSFQVPFIGYGGRAPMGRRCLDEAGGQHEGNAAYLLSSFNDVLQAAVLFTPRNEYRDMGQRLEHVTTAHDDYETYCRLFGVKRAATDLDTALKLVHAAHDAYASPEARKARVAKAEAAQARARKRNAEAATYLDIWNETGRLPPNAMFPAIRKIDRHAVRAMETALQASLNAEKLAAWLNGSDVPLYASDASGCALLRIKGDEIQTSQGASFPLEHGRKAFALIRANREAATVWLTNGHTIHLGHFKIDRIEADGTVRAGCHRVAWSEIERIAGLLGLI